MNSEEAFKYFQKQVLAAGLTAVSCTQITTLHWRITGGVCAVNYYPNSRRKTIYINATTAGTTIHDGSTEKAIQAALGKLLPPLQKGTKRMGANWTKRMKRMLLRKNPFCIGCKTPVTFETITVDHKIPLNRGGSNRPDNLQGMCRNCNGKKGNSL